MSHKFRFTKDSRDRLKSFSTGEERPAEPEVQESPAPAAEPALTEKPAVKEHAASAATPEAASAMPRQKESGVIAVTRTNIGRVRKSNQDAVVASAEDALFGIADGMGGHNGGETASAAARDGLLELLCGKAADRHALCVAIGAVNRKIFCQAQADESLSGMGTTLTVLWFEAESVLIGHVGDSRAYRLRNGRLEQITDDHSVVAELVRGGMLTKEQAATHPMRNVITRAVGTEDGIEIDLLTEKRQKGDVWLICSDGLYGMVPDEMMEEFIRNNEPEKAADLLIEAALKAGGRDNVSLALLVDQEGGK